MKNKSEAKPTASLPYKGVQKVDRNGAENLRQLFVTTSSKMNPFSLHYYFTEASPDFRVFSLETLRQLFGAVSVVLEGIDSKKCRQCDGKMSVVFTFFPHISQYMRNVLIQFDIASSYLYVVVLQNLPL